MAYALNRGGFFPGWDIYEDDTDTSFYQSGVRQDLLSRIEALKTSGRLSDVKIPSVSAPTSVSPSLGRISSLADYLSSGNVADLQSELKRAIALSGNKQAPETAYLTEKALSGYGRGLSDIRAKSYGTAQSMHLQELNAENAANQAAYQANLQDALRRYDLDIRKAMNVENELKSLQEMVDKYDIAGIRKKPIVSSPSRSLSLNSDIVQALEKENEDFRNTYSSGGRDPYWWTGSPRQG